ncbi:PadR family transcriptional regulator [Gordonibacter sp. 28C]|uniref:PadR family transcriptional regulator n=1 Tax=Gordonibacter sp. 28C TaxID=2078569 RepID=UPI000DF86102|nr:PadR family transcriptional regulator [Gordonibacter sp. 28C]RDB58484.1 PadR family transcriptional regulator [Gordonibacter sp. 28C]
MQQRFAQQMKKGALDMLVLKLLEHEEKYGYQLISELRERSGGAVSLKEGTLYPLLYRLEDGGLVASRTAAKTAKEPARKYYAITEQGRTALGEMFEVWSEFNGCVSSIMEEEQ